MIIAGLTVALPNMTDYATKVKMKLRKSKGNDKKNILAEHFSLE